MFVFPWRTSPQNVDFYIIYFPYLFLLLLSHSIPKLLSDLSFPFQSGVSEVIYFVEKRLENSDIAYIASHKLLSMAGVKVSLLPPVPDYLVK